MDKCPYEKTIDKLDKEIFGNGRKGLAKEFEHYVAHVEELTEDLEETKLDVKSLAVSYSALVQAMNEKDITEKLKAEAHNKRSDAIKLVGSIIGIGGTLFGIVMGILNYLEKINV